MILVKFPSELCPEKIGSVLRPNAMTLLRLNEILKSVFQVKFSRAIFAELIELKAKTASIFPFLLGLAYSLYHYQSVNLSALAIYFVAMFMFNCFVDIWDNYNDYHKAVDTDDYQKNTNIIGRENLSMGLIKSLLAFFFFGSLILGIIVA